MASNTPDKFQQYLLYDLQHRPRCLDQKLKFVKAVFTTCCSPHVSVPSCVWLDTCRQHREQAPDSFKSAIHIRFKAFLQFAAPLDVSMLKLKGAANI